MEQGISDELKERQRSWLEHLRTASAQGIKLAEYARVAQLDSVASLLIFASRSLDSQYWSSKPWGSIPSHTRCTYAGGAFHPRAMLFTAATRLALNGAASAKDDFARSREASRDRGSQISNRREWASGRFDPSHQKDRERQHPGDDGWQEKEPAEDAARRELP